MAAEPGQASGVPAPPEEKSQDQGSKTGSAKRPEQTARVLADEDVMTVADVANPDAVGEFTNEVGLMTKVSKIRSEWGNWDNSRRIIDLGK
uniref:ABC transporter permease n=1 Tax=Bursaphelenchus xylophilus TaxID=6326 RepID=A0A1I7SE76_BURXY